MFSMRWRPDLRFLRVTAVRTRKRIVKGSSPVETGAMKKWRQPCHLHQLPDKHGSTRGSPPECFLLLRFVFPSRWASRPRGAPSEPRLGIAAYSYYFSRTVATRGVFHVTPEVAGSSLLSRPTRGVSHFANFLNGINRAFCSG
jgi:hypothetical protein